ncbi:MAG: hypothetical protein V7724_18670 [Sediminicola sp.]|tara:strand:+ start:44284 stop:44622 length:339 start_codon:yes stop_codon:yes gene_type:complete
MNSCKKLIFIKVAHTLIWLFFNLVIGYMLYAVITDNLDLWLWICVALVLAEGLVLLAFKWTCPLTILARRYSSSTHENFDIYLPEGLAKNTKLIYTLLSVLIFFGIIVRLVF